MSGCGTTSSLKPLDLDRSPPAATFVRKGAIAMAATMRTLTAVQEASVKVSRAVVTASVFIVGSLAATSPAWAQG